MLKVIADSRKVWYLLIQRISYKPPVRHIHSDFFQRPAQRTDAVDMLDKHNFEQHDRVYAGAAVIFAV